MRCVIHIAFIVAFARALPVDAQIGRQRPPPQFEEEIRIELPRSRPSIHKICFPRQVWDGIEAKIFVLVKNTADAQRTFTVAIEPTDSAEDCFKLPERGQLTKKVALGAHSQLAVAFGEITARRGLPGGYGNFVAYVDDEEIGTCVIRNVRGSSAQRGKRTSLAILVALAAVSWIVLTQVMRRLSGWSLS